VKGLDLCAKTDLTPVANTKAKVDKKEDARSGDAGCYFKMRTLAGRDATMLVTITTLESVDEAKHMCQVLRKSSQEMSGMTPEGSVSGLGEESDGFSLEEDKKAYQEAQYRIRARFENRVIEVWLGVFGKPFIPKATLAEQARTVVQATAALASRFKQGEVPAASGPR
jgi:hypothetical protein